MKKEGIPPGNAFLMGTPPFACRNLRCIFPPRDQKMAMIALCHTIRYVITLQDAQHTVSAPKTERKKQTSDSPLTPAMAEPWECWRKRANLTPMAVCYH